MKTKLDKTHVKQLQNCINESLNEMEQKHNAMCVCLFNFNVDGNTPDRFEEELFEEYLTTAVSKFTKMGYHYSLTKDLEGGEVVFRLYLAIEQYYIDALKELFELQDYITPETYTVLFGSLVCIGDKNIKEKLLKVKEE